MLSYLSRNQGLLGPILDPGAPSKYKPQLLTGTGTTESHNTAPMTVNRLYMVTVGAEAVRIGLSLTGGNTDFVPANGGFILPAGKDFYIRPIKQENYGSIYLYAEAADGSSDYELTIQQIEP